MREHLKFYIGGAWVDPAGLSIMDVENPATEEVAGRIAVGGAADVERAVAAARAAFPEWSRSSRNTRLDLLQAIASIYERRNQDLGDAIREEMGAPAALACGFQTGLGAGHIQTAIDVLKDFQFEERRGATLVAKEPIGVCGLITPWNWPLNQIAVKVLPALATGCTMILKPSEIAPFSAQILAEIMDEAGVPAGVFNMIQGDGPGVGVALSRHPDVDMISFTGSTRAGVEIARNAADTVKRVCQELGGKGPNILLDDASLPDHVRTGVNSMMMNSGQTCSAPSRMLVPASRLDEVIGVARETAEAVTVGDPTGEFTIGPVSSRAQFDKVQALINEGIAEGASLVCGGPGRPEGLERGHYVKPTVFANVTNDMTIAREEIFGPVLVIIAYDDLDHAIEIANETEYGLAAFVGGEDLDTVRSLARRIHAGWVCLNDGFDFNCPFGGVKRSGNGREWGSYGFDEYLEVKGILNYFPEDG